MEKEIEKKIKNLKEFIKQKTDQGTANYLGKEIREICGMVETEALSQLAVSVNEVAVCSARKSYQSCDLHHDNEHGCEECGNYEQTER